MASVVPVKEKKLMDVKTRGEPSWILMQDLAPKGMSGVLRRDYHWYYKCVNAKKGSMMEFLRCWQLTRFSTTIFLTGNSNVSGYASTTEEGPVWKACSVFLTMTLSAWPPSLRNSITAETFHILIENNTQ